MENMIDQVSKLHSNNTTHSTKKCLLNITQQEVEHAPATCTRSYSVCLCPATPYNWSLDNTSTKGTLKEGIVLGFGKGLDWNGSRNWEGAMVIQKSGRFAKNYNALMVTQLGDRKEDTVAPAKQNKKMFVTFEGWTGYSINCFLVSPSLG